VVVGAGVVGLATARSIARTGRSVIVLERNDRIGAETSSRNSEVIHAGIYYPAGSLKARLCVRGKALLYDYLRERALPHAQIGKLIVAVTPAEQDRLGGIIRAAAANGVKDLEPLDSRALAAREPNVRGVAAVWSPSTGILDAHALMLSLQADLEAADGLVALNAPVESIAVADDGIRVRIGGDDPLEIGAACVVNAAGLEATALARRVDGLDAAAVPSIRYAKGNYFVCSGPSPFRHLIYPLPVDGGLGIHATLDLDGRLRFGPDVEWSETVDYTIDESRTDAFYAAIRTYWPELPDGGLMPGYVGVRPKLAGPGEPAADFAIVRADTHRAASLVHLFGIESPGLTACLAIAETVVSLI
jgi:L-2-hydroxyglutarate oxidase LhgO